MRGNLVEPKLAYLMKSRFTFSTPISENRTANAKPARKAASGRHTVTAKLNSVQEEDRVYRAGATIPTGFFTMLCNAKHLKKMS
jgi:hypothetical protein